MADIKHAIEAVKEITTNIDRWSKDYTYSPKTNEYAHRDGDAEGIRRTQDWFDLGTEE